jgi:hypothetical protein
MSDDGKGFEFNTWNIYPGVREYDRAWPADGISMINIIEQSCFWHFLGWVQQGRWPALAGATIDYRQRIYATDTPLKIHGWLVAQPDDFDATIAYEVRPEAAPDSDPLFTAEIRWQALEIAGVESTVSRLDGSEEFRSATGSLT